jgi:hypothetical protein
VSWSTFRTQPAISAVARLVKPGGLIITEIPVAAGLPGKLIKLANPALYSLHQPLNRVKLAEAHRLAGLEIVEATNIFPFPGVFDENSNGGLSVSGLLRKSIMMATRFAVSLLRRGIRLPCTDFASPYVVVVARVK